MFTTENSKTNTEKYMFPVVLTITEASAALRVSKWTLYQLIRSRQLTTVKIGRRRLVPVTAIQTLVDKLGAEEAV